MYESVLKRMTPFVSALAFWACSGSSDDFSAKQSAVSYALGTQCQTLYAGQTINAGSVCVSVDGDNLDVAYTTTGGWQLDAAHLWIGDSLSTMPQTKTGNPQIGQFPYKSGDITGATSYLFAIPLSSLSAGTDLCGHTFDIAAHAALRKADGSGGYETQTGWGDGTQINGRGSWATYFTYTVTCDTTPPPPPSLTCETGFALGDATFVSLGLTRDRWGWEVGPLAAGASITEPLYAGAAQNDPSKGTLVGSVAISYDGNTVSVSYSMNSGYVLDATHLYAGTTNVSTISPGQYGNTHDPLDNVSSDAYSIGGFDGQSAYVVAHAVVCH